MVKFGVGGWALVALVAVSTCATGCGGGGETGSGSGDGRTPRSAVARCVDGTASVALGNSEPATLASVDAVLVWDTPFPNGTTAKSAANVAFVNGKAMVNCTGGFPPLPDAAVFSWLE